MGASPIVAALFGYSTQFRLSQRWILRPHRSRLRLFVPEKGAVGEGYSSTAHAVSVQMAAEEGKEILAGVKAMPDGVQ